jgi:predicted dehydrogenase
MKILIAGLGSIGRRHLTNLRRIEPAADITIWHQRSRNYDSSETDEADRHVYTLAEALETRPQAVLITSPAAIHVATAMALAREGIHLLIEKPLSHTFAGVDDFLELARRQNLVVMVGYNFRFYEPLQIIKQALDDGLLGRVLMMRAEAGQFLPDWRPGSDYRLSGSARSDLGGGVVLELSHELDYARWLMGEVTSVSARVARLSDLEIDSEDTAEIILQFSTGALGSIHLDMVQQPATRTCRISGTAGTITWDAESHSVRLFETRNRSWRDLSPASDIDRNEMYVAELRHFLECVKGNATPLIDGFEGRRILEIALAIRQSSAEQRAIEL